MIGVSILRIVLSITLSASFYIVRSSSLSSPPSSSLSASVASPPLNLSNWKGRMDEMRRIFREEVYGVVPDVDGTTSFAIVDEDPNALDGIATRYILNVTFSIDTKDGNSGNPNEIDCFCFPVRLFVPNGEKPSLENGHPVFLFVCNRSEDEITRDEDFSGYWPVPDIVGSGFATAAFWAGDVDPDDGKDDFANGIHPLLDKEGRNDRSWGTIAAWAWGMSRILDVLTEGGGIFRVDPTKVVVIGHSRGGKTALWAAVEDERFPMAVSNNSGCTGAALSKRKQTGEFGETIQQINDVFPNWFCRRYRNYNGNEDALPVDQHLLLALLAPRALSVASAAEDDWADPKGEYLSIRAAAPVWGLSLPEHQPPPEAPIDAGSIHYHLRSGPHDLNVCDWNQHMALAKRVFGMS